MIQQSTNNITKEEKSENISSNTVIQNFLHHALFRSNKFRLEDKRNGEIFTR